MVCCEIEVIKYYLKCELGKYISVYEKNENLIQRFNRNIEGFPTEFAKKLMVFLSGPDFRNNGLYHYLGEHQYIWDLKYIDVKKLILPPINPKVNPILDCFEGNLAKFAEFLKIGGFPKCREFRDVGRRICHDRIIAIKREGQVNILDGAHRAVILVLRGSTKIQTYLCRKAN